MCIIYMCVSLSSLEGTEEKLRNRESRPEDLHIIAELREMVTEREALVKKLVVGRSVKGDVFNLGRVCIIKRKKSRLVSVSYLSLYFEIVLLK